ncbi:MAG: aldo/keto reductase [Calditrichaeota bacterium]|nr:MAG: aldo/keto reductase [Calditrichota bacterium]
MEKISRRKFIKQTTSTVTAVLAFRLMDAKADVTPIPSWLGPIQLGKANVQVTHLALGTGSNGWDESSDQVRLGKRGFLELVQHAYDRGVRFVEGADIYGSHLFIAEALRMLPREKLTLMTKIWNRDLPGQPFNGINKTVDRFRREMNTDMIDIVLLHCMTDVDWTEKYRDHCDALSELKQKGVIKSFGVSCHDFGALKAAAESDWVEVILARINAYGPAMDASPAEVMAVLERAHQRGIGIIGMKLFGCGECANDEQRQKSLEFVCNSGNVDCMTIGFTSTAQIDDVLVRIKPLFERRG